MCALKVHYTHLDHIEKSTRTFLWHGKDIQEKNSGKCLVKWDNVCLSKKAGGLGVLNLREHNKALLMKNIFKFYNCHNIPWVNLLWRAYCNNGLANISARNKGSFWWKSCLLYLKEFKDLTTCTTNKGNSILVWEDKWAGANIHDRFPELHSFAKNTQITLQQLKDQSLEDLYDHFHLPLSLTAVDQLNNLHNLISNIPHSTEHDIWSFSWGGNRYSTKKVYEAITTAPPAPKLFIWI
jgi:hypothetical protein